MRKITDPKPPDYSGMTRAERRRAEKDATRAPLPRRPVSQHPVASERERGSANMMVAATLGMLAGMRKQRA